MLNKWSDKWSPCKQLKNECLFELQFWKLIALSQGVFFVHLCFPLLRAHLRVAESQFFFNVRETLTNKTSFRNHAVFFNSEDLVTIT